MKLPPKRTRTVSHLWPAIREEKERRWRKGTPPFPDAYMLLSGSREVRAFWTGLRWSPIPEPYPSAWRYLTDAEKPGPLRPRPRKPRP